MSNNQVVIDTLIKKRDQLQAERNKVTEKLDAEIAEVENAIRIMSGKREIPNRSTDVYDDENPDYITGNEDGA